MDENTTQEPEKAEEEGVYLLDGMFDDNAARGLKGWLLACAGAGYTSPRLFMTCGGGHLEQAFSVFDLVRVLVPGLRIYVTGQCKSAATLILLSARPENRYAGPNARFMVHCAALLVGETALRATLPEDLVSIKTLSDENGVDFAEAMELHTRSRLLIEMVAAETGMDPALSERLHTNVQHFSAEEARTMGFVSTVMAHR